MRFRILIEAVSRQVEAILHGAPNVRGVKRTPIPADSVSVSAIAGKYCSDPTLRQISDEAYQLRDAERN
jgi:hypothetical protein